MYTEGLSEGELEYMIQDGTTWIGGYINNNKKGYMGQNAKNIRMYVTEMKFKYNKEYKHLQFDETIEQKHEEENKQKEIKGIENIKMKKILN